MSDEKSPLQKHFALFLFLALLAAIGLWFGFKVFGGVGMAIALVLCLPALAWGFSRVAVEGTHLGFKWLADKQLEQWEGKYYEFATVQVRIFEYEDALWFAAADVIKSTGTQMNADSLLAIYPKGCRVLPGNVTCLDAPTIEKFFATHPGQEQGRFLLWMRREVLAPWEKKRENARLPAN